MPENSVTLPKPQPIRLADYRPPGWRVPHIALDIALDPQCTRVDATLHVSANPTRPDRGPLRLDGEMQKLLSIAVNGVQLAPGDYKLEETSLTIPPPADDFTVEIVTEIAPAKNTALEGLYLSGDTLTSQCEAEGFRRITYFPDRPDVLAIYRVRLEAEKARFPVLLSNGNCIAAGDLAGGRHFVEWHDPFPKPCYLFAVVAGALARLEDNFVTRSGRTVALHLYVEPGNESKAGFALEALKRAMAWDEETFGLEYDLDVFQIVAVGSFNMGAMENKGLNIFNDKYILADPETATDQDYAAIEAVVAHEYFHNWTGNRITCRDWFQLSLKEGLTVFRDQEFQADMRGPAVRRIADVRTLRGHQFAEDAGPLAHPVRPDTYLEINNFYTATVYEKGAEVIRMLKVLLGREGFRKGMDLYIARHDGTAAAVEDFVRAMEDANGRDFIQFRRWYSQSGTPEIAVSSSHDPATATLTLTLTQNTAPTNDQPTKLPLHIPVAVGFVGPDGRDVPLRREGETAETSAHVLSLTEPAQGFRFTGVPAEVVPSFLRGFSAPCRLTGVSRADRAFLMRHDGEAFNRWDACQRFALDLMLVLIRSDGGNEDLVTLAEALGRTLEEPDQDPAFKASMLALPTERDVAQAMETIDVEAIHAARERVLAAVATRIGDPLEGAYRGLAANAPYAPSPSQAGRRALRNAILRLLAARGKDEDLARVERQFDSADNMTDRAAALSILVDLDTPARDRALTAFYDRFQQNPLVVDKWLALQAGAAHPDTLDHVRRLMAHEAFTFRNPNRIRALVGTFVHMNALRFHAASGAGYRFLVETALTLDRLNPQAAARLVTAFEPWRRFDPARVALMQAALAEIAATPGLSPNLVEITSRLLA